MNMSKNNMTNYELAEIIRKMQNEMDDPEQFAMIIQQGTE